MSNYFVKIFRRSYSQSLKYSHSSDAGLYGLPDLNIPDDFILLADNVITKCKGIQHEVKNRTH